MIRQPICVFMGHVDHGKTTALDTIRRTAVAKSEAGAITQIISSSSISIGAIKKVCGGLIKDPSKITIPGLLLIDTPGHAAFTNLRKRGGNLADIAVLVIDINEGIMPQTTECIEILKQYKTPFVIALNKLDLLQGWRQRDGLLLNAIEEQSESVKQAIEAKMYDIVGKLYEMGINADRFDRVSDYSKQFAIIPCAAIKGLGIPELLMVLIGLAQKYMENNLQTNKGPGKATVLEVKEEKGVGTVLDAVLYDGVIKTGDTIVIGNVDEPIVTKVKTILVPEKGKLKSVKEAEASAGIKIAANGIEMTIPGVPVEVAGANIEETKAKVQAEVNEVMLSTETEGVVIKAESLGSLEALARLLTEKGIKVKKASVGKVTKKDIADAISEQNYAHRAILCFNSPAEETADVKIIRSDIIYHIIEQYEKWVEEEKRKQQQKALDALTMPGKMQILRECIFRQNNPCVVGVLVQSGVVKADVDLIKVDGAPAGTIKSIQVERETVEKAEKGKEVAISLPGITAGRQIDEDDILYVDVPESDFKELKKYKNLLKEEDIKLLKELAEIKRKANPLWGV